MREFSDILIKAKENNDDDDGEVGTASSGPGLVGEGYAQLPPTKGATDEEIRANKQVLKMMSVNVKVRGLSRCDGMFRSALILGKCGGGAVWKSSGTSCVFASGPVPNSEGSL